MKNSIKKIGSLLMSAVTLVSVCSMAACKEEKVYDTETRPVVFSTDPLDGNFNPFFATSATDVTIAGMTQVSMLTTDETGKPKCGDDVPTVALAYKETMYNSAGNVTTVPADATKEKGGSTAYEFIIKNGMKFSNGSALTIKDVLFNLYVYLDPMYMGSATIYSTDIKGLQAYKLQEPDAIDDSEEQDALFYSTADQRIADLIGYLNPDVGVTPELTTQISKDIATVKELFREEVESDWAMYSGSVESYKEEYRFTEGWEVYYFNEGLIDYQYVQGKPQRDEEGKYLTSLDAPGDEKRTEIEAVKNNQNPDYALETYVEAQGCTMEQAKEYAVRDFAIDTVYANYADNNSGLLAIMTMFQTASTARDEFAAEARTEYFKELKANNGGKLIVPTISGITTSKTSTDFNGASLGEEHDVLRIEINGIDPKAIWNFAFSVAPMYYYSGDYVDDDGNNVTALSDAIADNGTSTINGVANQYENFGVSFNDKYFFDSILQNDAKNGKPVGAGVYQAANEKDTGEVTKDNFFRNNWVFFKRNDNFDSMGGETVTDAKIKYLRYRVVTSDNIISALQEGGIDFGSPQATTENIEAIDPNVHTHLASKMYRANGYGYVGINPKFVPDLAVRQAIMKAMNTSSIVQNYYKGNLAEVITRPMSKESWAYPKAAKEYEDIAFTTDHEEIRSLVRSAGWTLNSKGIFEKDGKQLDITFTIAGESTDHPAHNMFQDAADTLRQCGFKVSVVTDINALKNLANGNLAVWAAAWSSTIDPDLYQVYHKDSNATSTKNWGYDVIFADQVKYAYEVNIINKLSAKIEEARGTLEREGENGRIALYAEALDLIMALAVELPTYQRNDLVVYNRNVINGATLNQTPSAYAGVYDRLWEVDYL